jgi:hypothetical protein
MTNAAPQASAAHAQLLRGPKVRVEPAPAFDVIDSHADYATSPEQDQQPELGRVFREHREVHPNASGAISTCSYRT